jgi:murein DD-endopeptidase MepM/ murein hydrolase activator NlpD
MRSPRYTILIASRQTGAVKRLTVTRRLLVWVAGAAILSPVLVAIGSSRADQAEVEALRVANDTLRLENESYRNATGELTTQIASLQTALTELSEQARLDPAARAAVERSQALMRSRATGGSPIASLPRTAAASPEGSIAVLRDLLGLVESRLTSVRSQIEAQQQLARATPSLWPLAGWLSSGYGNRRDPFTGGPDFHPGIDISAERGTPVRATADGTVESAGYAGNYGNAVVLGHGFGIQTRFGHLSRFAVRTGQQVKRGDVVGYVGSTGRATSSHLHYEIMVNGRPINPLRILSRP